LLGTARLIQFLWPHVLYAISTAALRKKRDKHETTILHTSLLSKRLLSYVLREKERRDRGKMDADEVARKLEEEKAHMKRVFHIRELGLFGSYIRGEETTGSDIDVLVEFTKGHKDFFNYMRLKFYLEGLFGRNVDLVMKNAVKSRLKDRILSEVEYV
jgi:predicted nucleotidyltransferase